MLKWFVNGSVKAEGSPNRVKFFNNTFISFMKTGTWIIYLLAIFLIGTSIYFFHIDMRRRKAFLQRRREIRRANEKPPQKRRPGVASRNHEIFRSVMGKVRQYLQPNDYVQYVLRYNEDGTIVACKEQLIISEVTKEENSSQESIRKEELSEGFLET